MTTVSHTTAWLALTLSLTTSGVVSAIRPPDNSSSTQVQLTDELYATMSNVDDVGLVIVWNGLGATTALQCEWTSGGNHGSASGNLNSHLTKGDNYIIFVLYNKVYDGGLFFGGGKWSYRFSLSKNGTSIWSSANHVRNNSKEIKYWKIHKATVTEQGAISVTDDIDSGTMRLLMTGVTELEQKLDASAGVATPF